MPARRFFTLAVFLLLPLLALAAGRPAKEKTGQLGGVVLSTGGIPIAGAHVTIQTSYGKTPLATTTGTDGRFLFQYLQPGLWNARAHAGNKWSAWERNIRVKPGETAEVTLRLGASSGNP